jgi:DNA-directed RNA polymerase specialized sigma24 family protein
MAPDGSVTRWIDRLKEGDPAAAQQLWDGYFRRMVEVARLRLRGVPRGADEEDVALSAFKSFCHGARAGRFPRLADRHGLWPLLVAITAHKCVDLLRREGRQKRCGGAGGAPRPEPIDPHTLVGREPSPEFVAQVAEQLDRLLARLDRSGDPELRAIALWKMEGDSTAEIAARLGCVRRTVERKLQVIARVWREQAEA